MANVSGHDRSVETGRRDEDKHIGEVIPRAQGARQANTTGDEAASLGPFIERGDE